VKTVPLVREFYQQLMLARLQRRTENWRRALHETGADQIEGDVRVRLLLWRSGVGANSVVIDSLICPRELKEALWRLNDHFDEIMSVEGAPVNVPAPVPPSLGHTIFPGIDTAGIYIWDGFFNARGDVWKGLLWNTLRNVVPEERPLIQDEALLRSRIEER
jgi:hypothetical protein